LTGGHQLKNAQVYEKSGAVEVVSDDLIEENPEILSNKIIRILDDPNRMNKLGEEFGNFAKPNAAKDVAKLIFESIDM
jgi:N-acetylglucosaminyl transferase